MSTPYMDEAFALARGGIGLASPNPMVGAVIVKYGEVVGRGFHTWDGIKHAEVIAIGEAGASTAGSTLYVTLEPCSHTGRTGPCVDAIIAAGISKVIAASEDPNPLVGGEGFRRLRAAGILVEISAAHSDEAARLNEAFFHFMRTGRPLVTLKSALTLDGKIAAPEDNTGWITSERARAHVQELRHSADAMLTGIGTALADDPLLTDRSGLPRARPLLRVVLDSTLRLPLESQLVRSAKGDLLIAATSAASAERRRALEQRGVEVRIFDGPRGRVDVRDVVSLLGERRCLSVVVEAGSKLNWAVLECDAVDKVFLYYAPKILGGLQSLSMAGGAGRMRRIDAILLERTTLHPIPPDEFAVEGLGPEGILMFTGIVEELGTVASGAPGFTVHCSRVLSDLTLGASVAVNGVCLTAVDIRPEGFSADLAPETLERTNLGDLRVGDRVNLERPLSLQTRLSGHIVQGHVDGTGTLESLQVLAGENRELLVRVPEFLDRFLVYKGSIAIDGISLTIASVEGGLVRVAIIPHTWEATNLSARRSGDRLNIECDILAKHVDRLLAKMERPGVTV